MFSASSMHVQTIVHVQTNVHVHCSDYRICYDYRNFPKQSHQTVALVKFGDLATYNKT